MKLIFVITIEIRYVLTWVPVLVRNVSAIRAPKSPAKNSIDKINMP